MSSKYVRVDDVIKLINTSNRGFCDYFIVDQIEELCRSEKIYDVDKVVKQLEELKSQVPVNRILDNIIKDKPKELGQLIAYDKAISIVKAGGIINE